MSVAKVVSLLDGLLLPLGFKRQKRTWNRSSAPVIDVIDVQVSKANHAMTVNAGVLDPEIFVQFWGEAPPSFVDEPSCTVRARIGLLMNGRDVWWPLDDASLVENVVEAVTTHALPFLERMHGRSAMEEFLTASNEVKRRYPDPPSVIYLALLMNKRGNRTGACTLLREFGEKTLGAWRTRAREVAERL